MPRVGKSSSPTRSLVRSNDILRSLIANSYLPRQIPPAITTRNFAIFCYNHYSILNSQFTAISKTTTQYTTFTVPREHNSRRHLALVHPIAQLGISLAITKHRKAIRDIVGRSSVTLYNPDPNTRTDRAFSGIMLNQIADRRLSICAQSAVILEADISRFFYTIYTHSIPWAVIGKEHTKKMLLTAAGRKKLKSHWSNDFDVVLQSAQSRETLGIPVGPDTSHLIAEILLSAVERYRPLADATKGRPATRLVDDFMFGFDVDSEAQNALGHLRDSLWEYNLQLNDDKTKILSSSAVFESRDNIIISHIRIFERTAQQQKSGIRRLLDATLDFCIRSSSSKPAIAFCRRMHRLKHPDKNLPFILQSMFRLGRDYPSCISFVAEFLINHRSLVENKDMVGYVGNWLKSILKINSGKSHDFELSWVLILSGVFKIELYSSDFDNTYSTKGVGLAILGLLREVGLLKVPLGNWHWKKNFTRDHIYGENWLLYYESVRRGWTKDKRIVDAIKSDIYLNMMLDDWRHVSH